LETDCKRKAKYVICKAAHCKPFNLNTHKVLLNQHRPKREKKRG
jgi:hypothetical protein